MQPAPEFEHASQAVSVLLVEDDPDFAALVRRCLAGVAGRPALTAVQTLEEALQALRSGVPDLVLADLGLPDSWGIATLERIAAATTCPIIVLTANEEPGIREAALGMGAYEFLHKGDFDAKVLGRLVRLAAIQARTFRSLRLSEARFRSLTQLSSDWYWEQDGDFRLTFMSSRMGERTGLAAAAYLGRRRWDLPALNLSEADWERHRAQLERHEPFRDFEMQRRAEDGTSVWLSISGEPVYAAAGHFKGYRGIGRDITLQKRAYRLQRLEHDVTRCLSEAETAAAGVSAVLRAICETLDWECGRYFEADEPAALLRFAGAWGKPSGAVHDFIEASRALTYRRGEGLSGYVWQSGEPLWVSDVSAEPRASGSSRRANGRAGVQRGSFVFPVISRGATLGVMSFACGEPRAPGEHLVEALGVIGSQVGQFLQRKHAELALRKSMLVLEKTFEHMDQGISIFDRELTLMAVNRRARELLAIPETVLRIGCGLADIIRFKVARGDFGPVDIEQFVETRLAIARKREPHVLQRQQMNGTILEIRGTPMPDGGLISVYTDVTASARSLQALRESEERFRETFELAGSGIAHVSREGKFLRVNRSLCRMLGYTEDELIGRSVRELSHPAERDPDDSQRMRFEKRYIRKDGSTAWVDLTKAIARDGEGRPAYDIVVMDDITEQKAAQGALQRFRTALDRSADMFFLVDLKDTRLLDFNETACAVLGYAREELIGRTSELILAGRTLEDLRASNEELLRERTLTGEATYRRKDGSTFPVEARRTVLETADGQILVVNSHDLTERKIEEARKSAHLRYQQRIAAFGQSALSCRDPQELAADAVQQVLLALGAETVVYVERGPDPGQLEARALIGADAGAGRSAKGSDDAVSRVLQSGVRFSAERCALPFDWARPAAAAIVPVPGDSGVRGALCAVSSERQFAAEELNFLDAVAAVLSAGLKRVTSEARLAFLAQFDSLTGLPNRALLAERFAQMIEQTRRRGLILGVLFVDLDDFKSVNDTLGHAAGDELLREVARRLEEALRPGDTVARISGDEFALVLADLARQDDAALVAQKIVDRLAAPFQLAGQEAFVTASVGIASYPADGQDAETLLGAADAAMYRAKQSGRNAFQFFTAEINQRTRARALLGAELRRAMERHEFTLAYQPKYDLLSMKPCGAEALLRWNHPERGVVLPGEFIPVLEETGLIVSVGEWVLRRACADVMACAASGVRPLAVAVNLSARQFRQQDLAARIRSLIAAAGVSPELIELEITESHLMHDPAHAVQVMRALRDEGIRIAIDDFGTGYSSLAYLTRFPVAALKIDRSFVAGIGQETSDPAIVRTIIEMARTLGSTVIAEGVETEAQVEFLRRHGCHQAQGYFFARPMPVEDFRALTSSATEGASGKARPALRYQ